MAAHSYDVQANPQAPYVSIYLFFAPTRRAEAHRDPPLYTSPLDHEFSAPFGLAAEYAHPLEVLILGTGTIGGPLLMAMASQTIFPQTSLHIITVYIWIVLRLFQAVEAHSGYGTFLPFPFLSSSSDGAEEQLD
jgi:hypothetical protein